MGCETPDERTGKAVDATNSRRSQAAREGCKWLLGARRPSSDKHGMQLQEVDASSEQLARWIDAIQELTYAEQHTFRYVERSFKIFETSLRRMSLSEAIIEIAGSVMDWLGAMRTALAHWERRFRRTHDEAPFLAACKREYDSVFAYRFLYRLRNYAQHLALPVHTLSVSDNGWVFCVDRDALLEQFDGWSTVKNELAAGPEQIELEPLIRTCMESLYRIAQVAAQHDTEELDQTLMNLEEGAAYFRDHYGDDVEPIVYRVPDDEEPLKVGSTITFEPTPTWDRLREIGRMAQGRVGQR